MIAAGIDLGGTKIAAQLFDAGWQPVAARQLPTPAQYDALVAATADLVGWAKAQAQAPIPVGIGAAGLVHPQTGCVTTANLGASGQPLPAAIAAAAPLPVTYLNDARAMALSEAVFGAGRGHGTVAALILGTGVGGGVVRQGQLQAGPSGAGGEFGHLPIPADLRDRFALPLLACGCGQVGCYETLLSGPGLTRLARAMTGQDLPPTAIAAAAGDSTAAPWAAWCALAAALIRSVILMADPDVVVIGGGLSQIPDLCQQLRAAGAGQSFAGLPATPLAIAQGGPLSGARGAAFAAWQGVAR